VQVGKPKLAGRLIGAAEAALETTGTTISPSNRADYNRTLAALRGALEVDECANVVKIGRELALEDALAAARRMIEEGVTVPGASGA
jgi:hypothetical protein